MSERGNPPPEKKKKGPHQSVFERSPLSALSLQKQPETQRQNDPALETSHAHTRTEVRGAARANPSAVAALDEEKPQVVKLVEQQASNSGHPQRAIIIVDCGELKNKST